MEREFSDSVCNIRSKSRLTTTSKVVELNSLTLSGASFQLYYVSIALIRKNRTIPMSEKITISYSNIYGMTKNFVNAVMIKYENFPPSERALELFSKCRQMAKDYGVTDKTLDDMEDYTKKVILEVVECDDDKLTELSNRFVKDIIEFYGQKAKEAGSDTIYMKD